MRQTMTNCSSSGASLASLMASWERSLRAADASWQTIRSYGSAVHLFIVWLERHDYPATTAGVTREACEAYFTDCLVRCTAGTVFTYHKCIKLFFAWLVDEGEVDRSPLVKVRAPRIPESPAPIISDDHLRALIRVCEGKRWIERRDMALVRLLIDTGMRRAEIGGLRLGDIDWEQRVLHIQPSTARGYFGAKNRRARDVPFGAKAAAALDRYVRARTQQRHADLDALWLTQLGALTYDGVYNLIQRRAQQAAIPAHIWPHLFRHTSTHKQLERGDQEGDIMVRMGWRTRDMLGRYGASVAAERARESYHRQPSPGDLL